MNNRKILLAHPIFGRGGAEVAIMLLIKALKNYFDIYILTRGGWNIKELNELAITDVKQSEIVLIKIPIHKLRSHSCCGMLWHALFLRYCRFVGKKYDICVTASRVIGWGRPAVHFLSDVVWNDELNKLYGENNLHENYIHKSLKWLGRKIAGKSLYELNSDDIFIANSQWTASVSAPFTTNPPVVVYPAVIADFNNNDWQDRKTEFISYGRISPEKKIEKSIEILEQVRQLGHDIGLTVFGQFDSSVYAQFIRKLAVDRPWIKIAGPIYGEQKSIFLPKYKYGINTCEREAFGIATAEMLKAGIIPFAPSQGAQKEIIENPDLIFENMNAAVIKIDKMLKSTELQKQTLIRLNEVSKKITNEQFKQQIQQLFLAIS